MPLKLQEIHLFSTQSMSQTLYFFHYLFQPPFQKTILSKLYTFYVKIQNKCLHRKKKVPIFVFLLQVKSTSLDPLKV